jgi:hypothetical protein
MVKEIGLQRLLNLTTLKYNSSKYLRHRKQKRYLEQRDERCIKAGRKLERRGSQRFLQQQPDIALFAKRTEHSNIIPSLVIVSV